MLDVLPEIEKSWIERYGKVALTGNPITFSDYSSEIGKHFEIAAYSPQKNYFAVTFTDVTDRVLSEEALNQSLADLKMAQQFAKIGNWKYNSATREVQWSDQIFEIMETDPSEGIIGVPDYEKYFSKKDFEKLGNAVINTLENGVPFELQFQIKISENKYKWVEVICQSQQTMNQNKGSILQGTIQDITASKEAEEELSNTNKLLRTVIDNIPDAIYMKDTRFRKIIANKGDAINSGMGDVSEIIGKTDYDIYPKEVADIYTKDDRKVIEKGETVVNREEILPAKNKDRIILTSKFPLRNTENKIVGLVGIGRDITELKENQSRLNLLQQTIQQTPLPVVITNKKGEIEFVNPGFTKISGYEFDWKKT